jgi:hypothetical protein
MSAVAHRFEGKFLKKGRALKMKIPQKQKRHPKVPFLFVANYR